MTSHSVPPYTSFECVRSGPQILKLKIKGRKCKGWIADGGSTLASSDPFSEQFFSASSAGRGLAKMVCGGYGNEQTPFRSSGRNGGALPPPVGGFYGRVCSTDLIITIEFSVACMRMWFFCHPFHRIWNDVKLALQEAGLWADVFERLRTYLSVCSAKIFRVGHSEQHLGGEKCRQL